MIVRINETDDSSYLFLDYLATQMLKYYGYDNPTLFEIYYITTRRKDQLLDWLLREKNIQGYHLTFFNSKELIELKDSLELTLELLKFKEQAPC